MHWPEFLFRAFSDASIRSFDPTPPTNPKRRRDALRIGEREETPMPALPIGALSVR
jgi:hypothetical protein